MIVDCELNFLHWIFFRPSTFYHSFTLPFLFQVFRKAFNDFVILFLQIFPLFLFFLQLFYFAIIHVLKIVFAFQQLVNFHLKILTLFLFYRIVLLRLFFKDFVLLFRFYFELSGSLELMAEFPDFFLKPNVLILHFSACNPKSSIFYSINSYFRTYFFLCSSHYSLRFKYLFSASHFYNSWVRFSSSIFACISKILAYRISCFCICSKVVFSSSEFFST